MEGQNNNRPSPPQADAPGSTLPTSSTTFPPSSQPTATQTLSAPSGSASLPNSPLNKNSPSTSSPPTDPSTNLQHGRANTPILGQDRIPPPTGNFSPAGVLSPMSGSSTASFVFPVRSMFANLGQQGGSGGGNPPLNRNPSWGTGSPSSPRQITSSGGATFERNRSGSISTDTSDGMTQSESLSQMFDQAAAGIDSGGEDQGSSSIRRASSARPPKLSPVLSEVEGGSTSSSGSSSVRASAPRWPTVRDFGPSTSPLPSVPESSKSPFFHSPDDGQQTNPGGSRNPTDRSRQNSLPENVASPDISPNPMRNASAYGFHDPNTYMLSPSTQSVGRFTSVPDDQDSKTPEERPRAGQVDPTPPPEHSIQQATTSRAQGEDGKEVYTFRDRPGARSDEEARDKPVEGKVLNDDTSMTKIQAPKPRSVEENDQLQEITKMGGDEVSTTEGDKRNGKGKEVEAVEAKVAVPREGCKDSSEPAVGPAIPSPTRPPGKSTESDMSASEESQRNMEGIVHLGPVGEAGDLSSFEGGGSAGSAGIVSGSKASDKLAQQQQLRRSMKESVDHQSSVQTFVDNQAHTKNLMDPNAHIPHGLAPSPSQRSSSQKALPTETAQTGSGQVTPDITEGMEDESASQRGDEDDDADADDEDGRAMDNAEVSDSEKQVSTRSSGVTTSKESDEPVMTVRFEHITTGDGHHVVVGREGKLEKCEDEPITTPGAVQGFGVLMVLEEDEETGDLAVRQVSENSTELLGLSPRYLFRLQCFSHILPRSQDDTLRDNIDYLPDPDMEGKESDENEGPQVFLLSGYGEPGSDDSEESPNARTLNRRREWTCWVAAHRPVQKTWNRTDKSGRPVPPPNLIVLEFELEGDPYNPLYPPMKVADMTGADSPGSGSGPARSTSEAAYSGTPSARTVDTESDVTERSRKTGTSVTADSDSIIDGGANSVSFTRVSDDEPVLGGLEGTEVYIDPADILDSTTSRARPLRALERMRRMTRTAITAGSGGADYSGAGGSGPAGGGRRRNRRAGPGAGGVGTMDVFAVLAQINDQLGSAADLDTFLKIVVGVIKDLTQFHRCLVYSFDAMWNGQVVAELVDWSKTHDLYKGLMFPMTDIPAQARDLYRINKVRLLYDRELPTARMVLRNKDDLEFPLDMTHSYLRAMSPIHLVYLRNMGVRSSMSVSIMAFGSLWGLIACHGYGGAGMRVSFPVRQMLKLLSDSISRNIERLSYAARLQSRKLISTIPTDSHPTGYIVSNADDLIQLFDADSGVLVIGDGAKILGPTTEHGQEILLIAEFLRLKRYDQMQISHNILDDYPELRGPRAPEVLSGLLYVPLSSHGNDFIAFLRKGQMREVHWAGKPYKEGREAGANLEPRQSFKVWSETIAGRARIWTDEQLETAGVLALVYGKFIEVWRQKESAIRTNQMTSILLTNASHEVRTPLNHIINYLELALDGQLDSETRENLSRSHMASKSLLFTINDLLDLTRIESGNETAFNDPFDMRQCIAEATNIYRSEASRKGLDFRVDNDNTPEMFVLGDSKKVRTVVANLVANAVKYTVSGTVQVTCRAREGAMSSREDTTSSRTDSQVVDIEVIVSDTGAGIPADKLEAMFVTFEQADSATTKPGGLGLGLAVVARIVEQLGGQLRAESEIGVGTRFFVSLQMAKYNPENTASTTSGGRSIASRRPPSHSSSGGSAVSTSARSHNTEIDTFVEAFGQSHMSRAEGTDERVLAAEARMNQPGNFPVGDSSWPVRPKKQETDDSNTTKSTSGHSATSRLNSLDKQAIGTSSGPTVPPPSPRAQQSAKPSSPSRPKTAPSLIKLRILVVEDDDVNRKLLERRLRIDGHTVLSDTNGQEAVDRIMKDQNFDCILMDIQMPIMDGRQSAQAIRKFEQSLVGATSVESTIRRLDGHIPIVAVSATLLESQKEELGIHFDGWMLKPVDFKRMLQLLTGLSNAERRKEDAYRKGHWERGGWLNELKDIDSRRGSTESLDERRRMSDVTAVPTPQPRPTATMS